MISAIQATAVASPGSSDRSASVGSSMRTPVDHAIGSSPFGQLMTDALGRVGQLEDQAQSAIIGLISGTGVDVHHAMIASEKASMAFEMALAVRNKAIQSYQSVMGMQF